MQAHVVIVGGGIAGLALGFHLRARGVDVRVVEGAARAGGNIRSELRDGGWCCEWGPNGFLDNEPATLRLIEALKLTPAVVRADDAARVRWVVRGGRLRRLPASPVDFLRSDVLSLAGRLRVLMEPLQPARRDGESESVFDFARRRIGRQAADVLVDAMVTGIYAGDARRLELQATFPRLAALERDHGGLFKGMRAARRAGAGGRAGGGTPLGPGGTLTSLEGGMEVLVQALTAALGERLHLNCGVGALERTGTEWRLRFDSGDTWNAAHVVLACPAWTAAPIVRGLDAALAGELEAIPSAPVAVLCCGYPAAAVASVEHGFGFLVPSRERLGILGTLYESWIFPRRAPAGHVLWRVILGGSRDRGALDRSDAELVQPARAAFEQMLGLRVAPVMTHVVRHARGIPQYQLGHVTRLARLDALLQAHPNLRLLGSSYRGVSMNAGIAEAAAVAERFAATPSSP
jgi:oxygen-dependent protoporphyrinogen oxidase